ncbi:MAG: SCO family protein [Candidatus Competibacteraceae bacterium]|jgi:protein SCO1/2|nr:SCO family protein [Candidatus Competibacteraceae bacterium]
MRNKQLLIIALGVLSIAAGVGLGRFFMPTVESSKPEISGIYISPSREVENFDLTNQSGEPFTHAALKDRWSLLFFGYTFCPDVCPATLAQLNQLHNRLAAQGVDADVTVWMISVDPARDTEERLKEYTAFFNPKFGGATGEREEIDKLAKQFGVYYKIHDPEPGADYYLVDHSAAVIVINPDARLQAVLTETSSTDNLVKDFLAIRTRYDDTQS